MWTPSPSPLLLHSSEHLSALTQALLMATQSHSSDAPEPHSQRAACQSGEGILRAIQFKTRVDLVGLLFPSPGGQAHTASFLKNETKQNRTKNSQDKSCLVTLGDFKMGESNLLQYPFT